MGCLYKAVVYVDNKGKMERKKIKKERKINEHIFFKLYVRYRDFRS